MVTQDKAQTFHEHFKRILTANGDAIFKQFLNIKEAFMPI